MNCHSAVSVRCNSVGLRWRLQVTLHTRESYDARNLVDNIGLSILKYLACLFVLLV